MIKEIFEAPPSRKQQKAEGQIIKSFNLAGCDIVWHKIKETSHGETLGKQIVIYGKKTPSLAWTLAHELAHALEPKEKKPPTDKKPKGFYEYETKKGKIITSKTKCSYPEGTVDLEDVQSGKHSFFGKHYYPHMTPEEFHASRRSKHYLDLACGALGISLEKALLSDPPKYLKDWWDRGYFYQWRVQAQEQKKLTDKKALRQAGAKARQKRQEPIEEE